MNNVNPFSPPPLSLLRRIVKALVTLGPIGYLPMCGTVATVCTMPLVVALSRGVFGWWIYNHYLLFLLILFVIYGFLVTVALQDCEEYDPSFIVVDEALGFLVIFYSLPVTITTLCAAFVLFRIFDIFKPLHIGYVEELPGAWGIILDDVAAGVITAVLMRSLLKIAV